MNRTARSYKSSLIRCKTALRGPIFKEDRDFLIDVCQFHLDTTLCQLGALRSGDATELAELAKKLSKDLVLLSREHCIAQNMQLYARVLALGLPYCQARLIIPLLTIDLIVCFTLSTDFSCRLRLISIIHEVIETLRNTQDSRYCTYDRILAGDPSAHYESMSDETQRYYRCRVEELSELANCKPHLIAQMAFDMARLAQENGHDLRESHVGYWLAGDGYAILAESVGVTIPRMRTSSGIMFVFNIISSTFSLLLSLIVTGVSVSEFTAAFIFVYGVMFILFFEVSSAITGVLMRAVSPFDRKTCGMNYATQGIPDNKNTAVVVSLMLRHDLDVDSFVRSMEHNFLRTNDSNVIFVVVADFNDSLAAEPTIEEEAILRDLGEKVEAANIKYFKKTQRNHFVLAYRRREYCERDHEWRGYERKRGKLLEFARHVVEGNSSLLFLPAASSLNMNDVVYALFIDEDSKLDFGAVAELVSVLAHPLNKPCIVCGDHPARVVVEGHAGVVPTTLQCSDDLLKLKAPDLLGLQSARILRQGVGDLYQSERFKLFGVENYCGKILVEVAAYHKLCFDAFPPGIILSHDTVEGAFLNPTHAARALITENLPDTEGHRQARSHRWIRGDLQNAFLLLRFNDSFWSMTHYWKSVIVRQFLQAVKPIAIFTLSLFTLWSLHGTSGPSIGIEFDVAFSLWMVATSILGVAVSIESYFDRAFSRVLILNRMIYAFRVGCYNFALTPLKAYVAMSAIISVVFSLVTGTRLMSWRPSSQSRGDPLTRRYNRLVWIYSISCLLILLFLFFFTNIHWLVALIYGAWASSAWLIQQTKVRKVVN